MSKKYILLSESRHYGWCGDFITLAKANRLLKKEAETETFYIFSYCHEKKKPFRMKIRYPIGEEYYDTFSINEYKEEIFEEDDDFVIITHDKTNLYKNSLILTHKP